MTVFGINGSPRKGWNTATLLKNALEGAASQGADTELVHLYELSYQGCISCFACKMIDGPNNGRCAVKDDLEPLLDRIRDDAEAIILASPVYFSSMTGEMRSFMERLFFPYLVYSQPPTSLFPRKIRTGAIYTMNLDEAVSVAYGYKALYASTEMGLGMIFGSSETLCCYDTYQFPDYSKVEMGLFDPEKKAVRRRDVFPEDCRKAFQLGCRMASGRDCESKR
jgi:multimeric flavodoxin WrbA